MRVRLRVDQLHVDAHLIARFLHAAFENVRHAKLLARFRDRFAGFALVLLRRRARDDFQVRDLRRARQDFVLNAVREVGVRLVARSDFRTASTAIDFPAIADGAAAAGAEAVESGVLFENFGRRNWNASKPAAITASATVIPTSFRPVLRLIGSLGRTSSARLIPSGVSSKAQARMSATGKPRMMTETNTFITQPGASKVGNKIEAA